jgi:hypothetical protein
MLSFGQQLKLRSFSMEPWMLLCGGATIILISRLGDVLPTAAFFPEDIDCTVMN